MPLTLQEKILQAASELFYSQGIRATGVDAIVKAANTTKMSLYKYFPSKDDLVIAFLRKRDEDFRGWFTAQVDAKADTPKAKLLAVFDVIGEWMAVPEFRGCAFINAAAEFSLEGNPVHQVSAEFYDHFRSYIADLAGQCGSKSPESLALQLSLLVEGAIVSEQMKRHSGAAEQAKQAAIVLIEGSLSCSHISINQQRPGGAMSEFFHEGSRQLQDRFETRPMADRLVDAIVSDQISPEDKAFIEEQNMFFLATVDREGRPNCSYKGGSVGLVKVIDEQTLAFPLYDGSGMYLSAGNVLVNPNVGLLFVDFQRQARLRLNGSAFIQDNDPLMSHWSEAEMVLRVKLREMFPNCPRYIHKMALVEESAFVPKQHCETPAPDWKRLEVVADVLPPRDAHLAGNEQDAAAALNRK